MQCKLVACGLRCIVTLGIGFETNAALAQTPIQVSVRHGGVETNYQAFAAGASVPINISAILTQFPNFGASGDFVRVDDSTDNGQAIGPIQVSNANALGTTVSVFVANTTRAAFPTDPLDPNLLFLSSGRWPRSLVTPCPRSLL